jgi:hypothetical protein
LQVKPRAFHTGERLTNGLGQLTNIGHGWKGLAGASFKCYKKNSSSRTQQQNELMFVPGKHFQPNIMKQPKGALTYSEIMFI